MARPSCSFCGKSQDEVERLIAGPAAFICNACVELCVTILREQPYAVAIHGRPDPDAGNAPAPPELGPNLVLVQVPDGSVHGCERESEWTTFQQDGAEYEWCATRGLIRGDVPLRVVAVRNVDSGRPAKGVAFPITTNLTDEHARRVVREMWQGKSPG